jgi:hypothetical protein
MRRPRRRAARLLPPVPAGRLAARAPRHSPQGAASDSRLTVEEGGLAVALHPPYTPYAPGLPKEVRPCSRAQLGERLRCCCWRCCRAPRLLNWRPRRPLPPPPAPLQVVDEVDDSPAALVLVPADPRCSAGRAATKLLACTGCPAAPPPLRACAHMHVLSCSRAAGTAQPTPPRRRCREPPRELQLAPDPLSSYWQQLAGALGCTAPYLVDWGRVGGCWRCWGAAGAVWAAGAAGRETERSGAAAQQAA